MNESRICENIRINPEDSRIREGQKADRALLELDKINIFGDNFLFCIKERIKDIGKISEISDDEFIYQPGNGEIESIKNFETHLRTLSTNHWTVVKDFFYKALTGNQQLLEAVAKEYGSFEALKLDGQDQIKRKQILDDLISTFGHLLNYDITLLSNNDLYVDLVDSYRKVKAIELEKKREMVEQNYLPTAIEKIKIAIKNGILPIDVGFVEQRLQGIHIVINDQLYSMDKDEFALGYHSSMLGTITLPETLTPEKMVEVIVHELLHELSGRTAILSTRETKDGKKYSTHKIIRYGVEIEGKQVKMTWINEAITEMLAMKIVNTTEGSYKAERELLLLIIKISGIEESLFIEAYFENSENSETGRPKWKYLWEKINSVFGQQFLTRLEKYIKDESDKRNVADFEVIVGLTEILRINPNFFKDQFDTKF